MTATASPIRHRGEVRLHAVILAVGAALRRGDPPEEVVRLAIGHDAVANNPPLGAEAVKQIAQKVIKEGPPWPE